MNLREKVVVITGASSGIGRAAAVRFARKGAHVVLAGRRAEALEDAAVECRAAGGQAVTLQADVTNEADVNAVAARALGVTGVIDVWVNNAGVTLFGSLEEAPLDEHRRVIDTNLFGAIHGARAALPIFRKQKRGILINVSSILGKIGQPFVPSYVISKFALRGLTEALRAELADQYDIHVCTLLPYAVDTEHFESGANHVGLKAYPLPPVQTPEKIAEALVRLAEHPVRERHVPRYAVLGLAFHSLFPRTVERILFDALARWHFSPGRESPTEGNLYLPQAPHGKVHGERPPQLNVSTLVIFAARRFVAIQLDFLRRATFGRARRRPRPLQGAASSSPELAARALHPRP